MQLLTASILCIRAKPVQQRRTIAVGSMLIKRYQVVHIEKASPCKIFADPNTGYRHWLCVRTQAYQAITARFRSTNERQKL